MHLRFMRALGAFLLLSLLFLAPGPGFAAEGIFQGKVVGPPLNEPASPGWIFVEGGNHLLRRVEVAHAVIVFGQQVPPSERRKCGPECLAVGQQVRVTAEQDSSGEWRAKRVEILRMATSRGPGLVAQAAREGGRRTALQPTGRWLYFGPGSGSRLGRQLSASA